MSKKGNRILQYKSITDFYTTENLLDCTEGFLTFEQLLKLCLTSNSCKACEENGQWKHPIWHSNVDNLVQPVLVRFWMSIVAVRVFKFSKAHTAHENTKYFTQSTESWNRMKGWLTIKYITVFVRSCGASLFPGYLPWKHGIYHMVLQLNH